MFDFFTTHFLIRWVIRSPKNFEKIDVLKMWQLVSFWGGSGHYGWQCKCLLFIWNLLKCWCNCWWNFPAFPSWQMHMADLTLTYHQGRARLLTVAKKVTTIFGETCSFYPLHYHLEVQANPQKIVHKNWCYFQHLWENWNYPMTIGTLGSFVIQRSILPFRGHEPNFQEQLQNFEVAASKLNIDGLSTSRTSKGLL